MNVERGKGTAENNRLIFLVGFMGAGKTVIGRELARALEFEFIDLDETIERRAGASVKEIFSTRGEAEFRRMEHEALEQCLDLSDYVIALGGGAFVKRENRELASRAGITVWLDCPIDVCLERIRKDKTRPLLGERTQMQLLLQQRQPFYRLADYRVESSGRSPAEIALEIARLIAW
jgi:shikimate kinase